MERKRFFRRLPIIGFSVLTVLSQPAEAPRIEHAPVVSNNSQEIIPPTTLQNILDYQSQLLTTTQIYQAVTIIQPPEIKKATFSTLSVNTAEKAPEQAKIIPSIQTNSLTPNEKSTQLAPQKFFSPADTLKALENASPLAQCIVKYEIGGGLRGKYEPYDPNSIGAEGELGPAQLHPRGKLQKFYKDGYDNPFDPNQAINFLEAELKNGQQYHWAPVVNGLCG